MTATKTAAPMKSAPEEAGKRRRLPNRTDRPHLTPAFKAFKKAITTVSDFFWIARAGFHTLTSLRPAQALAAKDFLPDHIAAHLNRTLPELDAQRADQVRLLRYLCLVYAVTEYEEYLGRMVSDELRTGPLPTNKSVKLTIPLALPTAKEPADAFVHRLWAEARAQEVVGERYDKRPRAVDGALGIDVVKNGSNHGLDLELLNAACVIRNCVVHAGGRVDERTLGALGTRLPGLTLGCPIEFDDDFLFKLIEAMYHHAQDIDLLVRQRRPAKER